MEDLYVKPQFRRRGIAARLFEHCVLSAMEDKFSVIEWNVLDWNVGAKRFYAKIGAAYPDNGQWMLYRFDWSTILKHKACQT